MSPPIVSGSAACEVYREEVPLTGGTASQPAGVANLVLTTVSGSTNDILELRVPPLLSGTYDVAATLISSGSTVILGQLPPPPPAPAATGTAAKAAAAKPRPMPPIVFGTAKNPLPDGVAASDIASVRVIKRSTGTAVLVADFTTIATKGVIAILDRIPIVGGTAAAGAKGLLELKLLQRNGVKTGDFALRVGGLTANTSATLAINGIDIGNYTADSAGRLVILGHQGTVPAGTAATSTVKPAPQKLPASVDLFGMESISFHFADGTELFKASW